MGFHRSGWGSYLRYDEEQDRPQVSRELLARVAHYAQPYWGTVALLVVSITVTSLLELVPPLLTRSLVDTAIPQGDTRAINLLALGLIGIPLLTRALGVVQSYLGSRAGEGLIRDLRRSLYEHLQTMGMRFFTHTKTGELMSRLNNDVGGAQRAVTGTLVNIVTNVISLVATLGVMLSLNWQLTLIGVAVLPLLILPSRWVGRRLREITRRFMDANAEMNALMGETLNISGALLVKIFGRAADETARFSERATSVRDIAIRRSMVARWFFMGLGLVGAVGTALAFWVGGHMVLRDMLTLGTIIAFTSYLRQVYGPITALANAQVEFATSMVSFERVFEVLDLPVEIDTGPDAIVLPAPEGHVRFDGVWFRYEVEGETPGLTAVQRRGWRRGGSGAEVTKSGRRADGRRADGRRADGRRPGADRDERAPTGAPAPGERVDAGAGAPPRRSPWALRDVSFEIEPGQLAALVGPSGAGKTTATYLLPRLYDPTRGRILLDGHDLREIDLVSLSAVMGMVTQETYLFHDTVRANLLYANPNAAGADLADACRAANIHDFIVSLPEGYETIVGERGYRLSGGEKQRVAIARVILKDPRVLILDEATSHLDSESEALIQEALERIMRGRTSLVIAHRLSTVLSADVILVLDAGRIVQRGSHAELLAAGGLYRQLYERQFAVGGRGR